MARDPFEPIRLTEPVRPQAQPIDTFVVAEVPAQDNSLGELARGLSHVSSGLDSFLSQRQKRADEEDAIRAEADFHANNRTGYAEAVRQGLVPAQASRAYMEAYQRTQGDVAGAQLQQKFKAAYDAWGDKGNPDPSAFDNFLAGFIKSNIGENVPPGILRGLMPRLRTIAENGAAANMADVSRITKERATNARIAQADGAMSTENADALANRKQPNWQVATRTMMRQREEHIRAGGDADAYDKQLIDAVTAKAITLRGEGPRLLDAFFKSNVPGTSHTWGATPYGRDQHAKAIEKLESIGRQAQVEDRRQQAERQRAALDDVSRRMITALSENPAAPLPDALLREGEKLDGEFRTKAIAWQKTILSGRARSDPEALLQLHRDILDGKGMGAIRQAMQDGVIQSVDDLKGALAAKADVDKAGAKVDDILARASAKSIFDTIKQRTQSKDDAAKLFAPNGLSDDGLRLQTEFRRQLLDWSLANPNADVMAQEKAVSEIGQRVLSSFKREEFGPIQYAPGATSPENPFNSGTSSGVPAPAQPQQPAPAQGSPPVAPAPAPATPVAPRANAPVAPPTPQQTAPAPQPPAPTINADPNAVRAWVQTLSPEAQQAARDAAARTGQPIGDIYMDAYRRGIQGGTIQPSTPDRRSDATEESPAGNVRLASADTGDAITRMVAGAVQDAQDNPAVGEVFERVSKVIEDVLHRSASSSQQTPRANYQLAVLNDDPRAARILDFVSGPESGGNYEATYADARGKLAKITNMSINEVYAMMRSRGGPSTAAGRYQIIRKTAQGLMQRMGLTGDEKFTPELQDRMALQLLKDRGYDAWRAGRMSTNTFANNLAKEWASLPNLQTGRSHYAGDGLNRSHVTPKQVLGALGGDGEA